MTNIAFVGLGKMGIPMAHRLAEAGYELCVYDVVEKQCVEFAALHPAAIIVDSPANAVARASFAITMLPNSQAVEDAVCGSNGMCKGARPGMILIDMSSSLPRSTKKLSKMLQKQNISMIDAPVSGGVRGAQNGTLTIMAGGKEEDVKHCNDILGRLGSKIYHVGDIGAGHAVKALNNLLSAATMWITAEALAIGMKQGLKPSKILEVINVSSGKSNSTENKYPKFVLSRGFDLGFTAGLTHKDVSIALDMALETHVPAILASTVQQLWSCAIATNGEQMDQTEVAKIVEQWSGVEIRA
jgi:3-hydroxyisobutyrate dehydrogenase